MNEEKRLLVEGEFEILKEVPPRDPRAAARGRARFLAEAAALAPVSAAERRRHRGWNLNRKERFAMNILISILVVAGLLFGGSATVYAAQDDLPGQILYPVKTWSEDARLSLAADPQQQIDLLMEFAQRRVEEMVALTAQGLTPPAGVQARLERHLKEALQIAAGMDDASLQIAIRHIQTALQNDLQIMLQAGGEISQNLIQAREMIEMRLRLVETGQTDPQGFRQTIRQEQEIRIGQTETPTGRNGPQDGQTGPQSTPGPDQTPSGGPAGPHQPEHTPAPTAQPGPQRTPGGQGSPGGHRP
jgi:hypothetical protein